MASNYTDKLAFATLIFAHDVLKLLGQGKTNREIAFALPITECTVRNYMSRILNELELGDSASAHAGLRTKAALWAHGNLDNKLP